MDENEGNREVSRLEVRTFTDFWGLEKKLYSIYDFSLPFPISLRVLGVFVGVGLPWWGVLAILHFPWGSPWYLLWILPPALAGYFGSKPIFEGKTLFQYIRSRIQFLFENRAYKGMEPDLNKYGETIEIAQNMITFDKEVLEKQKLFSR